MLILLPLLAFFLLFLIFHGACCGRSSILYSSLVWGLLITLATELLSLFEAITLPGIAAVWVLINALLLWLASLSKLKSKLSLKTAHQFWKQSDLTIRLALVGIFLVLLGVGVIALSSPPNTWDAMNYHMSRVMHWMQNQSLAHYPTSFEPQLYQSPFTEIIVLHFQLLSGGDRFANLVQWSSAVGCAIGISLLAQQLGGSMRSQVMSALLATTVPMGILQASSVKNDYLLSFLLICLAHTVFLLDQKMSQRRFVMISFAFSVSLGLALLTKGTANIYILPFVLYFFWLVLRYAQKDFWKPLSAVAAVTLLINSGYYLRNFLLYSSVLGPLREGQASSSSYSNEALSVKILVSNVLRNLGSNLGTPVSFFNQKIYGLINKLHLVLGIDINDPRSTFSGKYYVPGGWSTLGFSGNEDNATNTFICLLILFSIVVFIFSKKLRRNKRLLTYLVLISTSFLLFSLLVKWQVWITRIHLPIFILFAAFTGVVLTEALNRKALNILAIALIITSLPWILTNRYRPLVGSDNIWQATRLEQYFVRQPVLQEPYIQAAKFLKEQECSTIGLNLEQPYEYPIWRILSQADVAPLTIRHVNVEDFSASLYKNEAFRSFNPCAIYYLSDRDSQAQEVPSTLDHQGESYELQWNEGRVNIYLPEQNLNELARRMPV